jgi:hypothetical protein
MLTQMRLAPPQARLAAVRASGLGRPPSAPPGRPDLARVVRTLGAVQIDSVNVVARAHLVPFYSRLGPYDVTVLDRGLGRRPFLAIEYWGHEASLVHPSLIRPLRWRMARAEREAWGGIAATARRRPELLETIPEALAHRPLTARELQAALEPGGPRRRDHWGWNWSDVKTVVEFLFWSGRVTSAGRNRQFERRYTLPERVWPADALNGTPTEADAVDALVEAAAVATGVATLGDLRDHFRLPTDVMAPAVQRLVAAGKLFPVEVTGWDVPAWRHVAARVPSRRASRAGSPRATALLSPFDPLVWSRPRAERIFGFSYRLEIYVPRERRVHGYYVLPFLLRGSLVARVDLRADRAAGALHVVAAWVEAGAPDDVADALAAELHRFAGWLGLTAVLPPLVGDLAADLAAALSEGGPALGA